MQPLSARYSLGINKFIKEKSLLEKAERRAMQGKAVADMNKERLEAEKPSEKE